MGATPRATVGVYVEQVPGRVRQAVEIADRAAGAGGDQALRSWQDKAGDVLARALGARPDGYEFGHRRLALAERHRLGAGGQVDGRVVGRVGTVDDDPAASRPRRADHGQRRLTPAGGAHLGEEIEVVLHHHDDARLVRVERGGEILHAVGEGGVEHRDRMAVFSQHGR